MNNNESEQTNTEDEKDKALCGPGCGCAATGLGTKGKIVVCVVVGLAAAAILARGFTKKSGAEGGCCPQTFMTDLSVVDAEESVSDETATVETKADLWRGSLDSLASLNKVALGKDAVFILLSSADDKDVEAIKKQIEFAASKSVAQGTTIGVFTLDQNAADYAQISSQVSVPCVLAMVKGMGMSVVSKDITEATLLEAIVTASRPSGCGPSGCGPSGCK